jgi:hypothetical protein
MTRTSPISLAGMILLLATDIAAAWWFGQGSRVVRLTWSAQAARSQWMVVPACLAVLLCVAGAAVLGAGLARSELLAGERPTLLVIFVLILVPALAALPLVSDVWDVHTAPKVWIYVLGLPWLVSRMWLVVRRGAGRVPGATA